MTTPTALSQGPTRSWRALLALLAVLAFAAAACGSSDSEGSAETEASSEEAADDTTSDADADADADAETETDADAESEGDGAVDGADEGPELRVVSLSATHTEIMFAIGAGDLLVAIDEWSNYPAEALELPNELSGFEPNVEAIAAYQPDLVLIGGDFTGLGDQLNEIGIDSWDGPAATSFDDVYAQIEQLGAATGHIGEAAELVGQMQTEIAAAAERAPVTDAPLSVYHELDATLYSADSTTFIGQVYAMFGLENIADPEGADAFGYPQLNAEYLVEADPDVIFTADGEDAAALAARDGWSDITAVADGNVFVMDADIASRWGPRIVDYINEVAAALETVVVPAIN